MVVSAVKCIEHTCARQMRCFLCSNVTQSFLSFLAISLLTVSLSLFAFGTKTKESPAIIMANNEAVVDDLIIRRAARAEILGQVRDVSGIIKVHSSSMNAREVANSIVTESLRANYDPLLVTAIVKSESTFKPKAKSNRGALGLMQVRPSTAKYISRIGNIEWLGKEELTNPEYNIKLGIAYLKYLEEKFDGDKKLALIAYNWGPGNLNKALLGKRKIPKSTIHYAEKILANHQIWKERI